MSRINAFGKKLAFILPAFLFFSLSLAPAFLPVAVYAGASESITCGDPQNSGIVEVVITVQHPNKDNEIIKWSASVNASDDASQKADSIRAHAPSSNPLITVGGTGNEVTITTKNANDMIVGWGLNDQNGSNTAETDSTNTSGDGQTGCFSASGISAGDGYVEITYQGHTETVNTTPGMTAAQIEDALVSQFKAAGIYAYISYVDLVPGAGTDGRYLYFSEPTTTALVVEVTDTGIEKDLAMLFEPEAIPTLSEWAMITLVLVLVGLSLVVIQRRRRLAIKG